MNYRIFGGFTTAALLATTLGIAPNSIVNPAWSQDETPAVKVSTATPQPSRTNFHIPDGQLGGTIPQRGIPNLMASSLSSSAIASTPASQPEPMTATTPAQPAGLSPALPNSALPESALTHSDPSRVQRLAPNGTRSISRATLQVPPPGSDLVSPEQPTRPATTPTTTEAVKVGEYQIQERLDPQSDAIAVIHPYQVSGRNAVTLYVRNIPVLTFLGSTLDSTLGSTLSSSALAASSSNSTPVTSHSGNLPENSFSYLSERAGVKLGAVQNTTTPSGTFIALQPAASNPTMAANSSEPLQRATAIAAQLNELHRANIDASTIRAVWDEQRGQYLIKAGETELLAMDQDTIAPNSRNNPSEDVLQAVNLLRRQLGNASPLTEIEGEPRPAQQVSLGPIQFTVTGMASWYGPGFHGNTSASGEVFDENDLTAAHRELPFGTNVRVTNMDNGLSVVVRINDRGPYYGNRIIDLSAAAAAAIGLTASGVAPVSLDVLSTTTANSQNP